MDTLILRSADPSEPGVAALLTRHFDLMRASSPADSCHVMRPGALAEEGVFVIAAELDSAVIGVGALKVIAPRHGEVKSMHTHHAMRGKGVARRILFRMVDEARKLKLERLSLETGSAAQFAAARALYHGAGFQYCPPFGEYRKDPLSVYMTHFV